MTAKSLPEKGPQAVPKAVGEQLPRVIYNPYSHEKGLHPEWLKGLVESNVEVILKSWNLG